MFNVKIDPSAAEIGFASMLTDLMRQNIEQHPERQADFDRLNGSIALEATDAEVAVTLDFRGGELIVYGGLQNRPDVRISTDSATVLELSNARLSWGLPDVTHETGRAVLKKMFNGAIKLRGAGLLLKPLLLVRFNKLLSVRQEADFTLLAGESVRFQTGLHWLIFVWPALLTILSVGLLAAGKGLLFWSVLSSIAATALWVTTCLKYAAAKFVLTNQRLWIRSGRIKRASWATALAEVKEIEIDQGLTGRLLGHGAMNIRGVDGSSRSFSHVTRALELREATKQLCARGR